MTAPEPLKVSPPLLAGEADPEVDYFDAIQDFASERLMALAKRVIIRLQRLPASGIFDEPARPLKTVWDEWCWYQTHYDNDSGLLSYGFDYTLDEMIEGTASEVPYSEAVLISCAVCEDQTHMPARSDDDICAAVREVVREAASRRSMSRFEEW